MRLTAGSPAPDFAVTDLEGRTVRLADYRGKRVMLSFYRYASCPLCGVRVHRLVDQLDRLQAQGLHLLAVYESSAESLNKHGIDRYPFPIIPDPTRKLYQRYGIESSWWGMMKGMVRNMGPLMKTMLSGKLDMEGDVAIVPADFLIEADGVVEVAHYGTHIGDHLPLERIHAWLRRER